MTPTIIPTDISTVFGKTVEEYIAFNLEILSSIADFARSTLDGKIRAVILRLIGNNQPYLPGILIRLSQRVNINSPLLFDIALY